MQGRKVLVLLFIQIVCGVFGQSVSAQEYLVLHQSPRFVQSNVLEMTLLKGDRGGCIGYYDISGGTFTPLFVSNNLREAGSISPDILAHRPNFLWNLDKFVFTVAQDGTATVHESWKEDRVEVPMAFPDKGLLLQESMVGFPPTSVKYVLRDKAGAEVDHCELPGRASSVSPAFGQDRNFFLMVGSTMEEVTKDLESVKDRPDELRAMAMSGRMMGRNRAALYSIKPFRQVSRGLFPSYNMIEYVYDEKTSDLVAVLRDLGGASCRFVRVRHTPDNKEQAFEAKEFDSINLAADNTTWRNGLILSSPGMTGTGIGALIEKRERGIEPKRVRVPYRAEIQGTPIPTVYAVNGDGTLLCVASQGFLNGGSAFRLYKVDFPAVTCVDEYSVRWDKDAEAPTISRVDGEKCREKEEPGDQEVEKKMREMESAIWRAEQAQAQAQAQGGGAGEARQTQPGSRQDDASSVGGQK